MPNEFRTSPGGPVNMTGAVRADGERVARLDADATKRLDAACEHFDVKRTADDRADALAACRAAGVGATTSRGERLDSMSLAYLAMRAQCEHERVTPKPRIDVADQSDEKALVAKSHQSLLDGYGARQRALARVPLKAPNGKEWGRHELRRAIEDEVARGDAPTHSSFISGPKRRVEVKR